MPYFATSPTPYIPQYIYIMWGSVIRWSCRWSHSINGCFAVMLSKNWHPRTNFFCEGFYNSSSTSPHPIYSSILLVGMHIILSTSRLWWYASPRLRNCNIVKKFPPTPHPKTFQKTHIQTPQGYISFEFTTEIPPLHLDITRKPLPTPTTLSKRPPLKNNRPSFRYKHSRHLAQQQNVQFTHHKGY